MKYSVILPTYNERENLPLMISLLERSFRENSLEWEVVIVEDNSPDGTLAVAEKLQDIYGKSFIKILSRPGKMGLGSAYKDGMNLCTGGFVFLMDADMSHHPRDIPFFIQKQLKTGADIVTGTRYGPGGGVAGWDLRRIITSRGANMLANLLLNPKVSDLTGSYRLYKKEVLQDLIQQVKGKTYVFQMEVIVRAQQRGYKVEEVPITFVDRIYGESKLGGAEIISYLSGLWALFCEL
jgi:dolichol-phosphate mannosyltransferase